VTPASPAKKLVSYFEKSSDHSERKNPATASAATGFHIRSLAVSYFRMAAATLSSALNVFTSEFGMGSGGSRSLLPPGKLFRQSARALRRTNSHIRKTVKVHGVSQSTSTKPFGCYMVKPHGQLVLVSFIHYCTSTPSLSTS
jgi:hypothetical protein